MADPKEIYLQPTCCADNDEVGRLWCEDPDPEECDEGVPWTRYVRADVAEAAALKSVLDAIQKAGYSSNSRRFDAVIRHKGFIRLAYYDSFSANAPTLSIDEAIQRLT